MSRGPLLFLALLARPALAHDPTGVALAPNGNVYVADPYRCRIFEVTPEGRVSHFAGSAAGRGSVDGPRFEACFGDPHGLAVAGSGEIFVADYSTGRVRRIAADGGVSTIAGAGEGFRDGPAAEALFDGINGIAVDPKGSVFVADARNHRIRRVGPSGAVSTFAGGEEGWRDGLGGEARFTHPMGLALAPNGDLLVADLGNRSVRRVDPEGNVRTIARGPLAESRPAGASPLLDEPWAMAAGADGSILVACGGASPILRLEAGGSISPLALESDPAPPKSGPVPPRRRAPLDRPCGLAFDGEGNLYVVDHFTGPALVLSRVSPGGRAATLVNLDGQPGGRAETNR